MALLAFVFNMSIAFAEEPAPARIPDVVVVGTPREDQPVGANQQPEWTTQRRFATTRVYVLAPWQVEFEQWWKGKFLRDNSREHLFQSEIEVGLPFRSQLDFYENLERTDRGTFRHQGNQLELRHALADWGKIPLNPTLYGEWKFNDHDPDAFEIKVLLGETLAPRWHWGLNAFYEQEVGGGRESEAGLAQGVSYTLIDEILSAGVEMNLERSSGRNFDGKPNVEFLIGPSIQWRPVPRMHLDLVPLFGATHASPSVEAYVVFGFDFWRGEASHYSPTSIRGR
ncbi:MAG TPA: hypothetical protein VHH73_00975 [Verrucomicrobiae bacterium]|nr:hypothetical protein [Verrucomicrobiae bacterium]